MLFHLPSLSRRRALPHFRTPVSFALPALLALGALLAGSNPAGTEEAAGLARLPEPRLPGRAWQAKWIWTPGDPAPRNSYTYFRKKVELGSAERDARIHVTADSRYQLYVNGRFVGRGPVRSDRRWLAYDTWSVTAHLKQGQNVVAVLVHHIGESTFQYMQGRGGLLAELVGFGGLGLARTDDTWRALRSRAWGTDPRGGRGQPRMSLQLGFNEIFDAREEPVGWKELSFKDDAWPRAVVIGPVGMEPWPRLVARDIPRMLEEPVRAQRVLEVSEVEPPGARMRAPAPAGEPPPISRVMAAGRRRPVRRVSVRSPEALLERGTGTRVQTAPGADASVLLDFGREVTGYPRVRIRGARGGEIVDLGYGEVLQDERGEFVPQLPEHSGRLDPDRDGVHYADRYICRDAGADGIQEFQTFDKRGFRYLQLDVRGAAEGILIEDVSLRFSTFPVKELGKFQCSDERLNRIWEIGRYTCQLNMEDGYTDCPWRERAQWWGDTRVLALINYYCFGDTTLIRRCLRQKGQSLNEEGMTWGVYPTDWEGGRLPSFTLIWISTLLEYYRYTGDRDLVRELFPRIRYSLDRFFHPREGESGLLKDVPYRVFIDRAPVETAGESGSLNAFYYDALRAAAELAKLADAPEDAGKYESRAAGVRQALNSRLWEGRQGVYRDSILPDGSLSTRISQQTNSLCVLFDIAPRQEWKRILDFIYAPGNRERVVEAGSPYFSFYQLGALYRAGRHQQALDYIRERWGRMLDWGATTWWETWKPGASFCHGWSGGPTYDLSAEVLGVRPLKPGFEEVAVRPYWGDLTHASGIVPTPRGEVQVAWQRDRRGRSVALRLELPAQVPAEVVLEARGEVEVNRRPRLPDGVTRLEAPAGEIRFRIRGGGSTLFEVQDRRAGEE